MNITLGWAGGWLWVGLIGWSTALGQIVQSDPPSVSFRQLAVRYPGSQTIYGAAFSPSDNLIAAATWQAVFLYDPVTYQERGRLVTNRWNFAVEFSPDGRFLASGDGPSGQNEAPMVRLWEVQTGRLVTQMSGHTDSIGSLAFSPDGQVLASGSRDGSVRLWEVPSGRPIATLAYPGMALESVAFSPQGILATAGGPGPILLWRTPWDQPQTSLAGHSAAIRVLRFSPNGQHLVSGSDDRTFVVWDLDQRQPTARLTGYSAPAWQALFLPDSRTLVTASLDGSLRVWDRLTLVSRPSLLAGSSPLYALASNTSGTRLVVGGEAGRLVFFAR